MQSHGPISSGPGSGRRMKLEEAARKLAASGMSKDEIMSVLDGIGARRPEVARALAALEAV